MVLYSNYEGVIMSSTEERITVLSKKLLDEDREPDFDKDFSEADLPSIVVVEFAKAVAREFSLEIPPTDFAELKNLRELVTYIDSRLA